jgi:uncharacterized membrane-anchored protein
MPNKYKNFLVILGAILIFGVSNYSIYHKESILRNGETIYLKLAPVDPRSLMQGDYMALHFEVADKILKEIKKIKLDSQRKIILNGLAVLKIDKNRVAHFKSLYDKNIKLKKDEVLIKYQFTKYRVKLITNAYFFEEGKGKRYQKAKYGKFKLDPKSAEAILVSLAEDIQPKTGE